MAAMVEPGWSLAHSAHSLVETQVEGEDQWLAVGKVESSGEPPSRLPVAGSTPLRGHPLMGVRPGTHTRLLAKRRVVAQHVGTQQPAPVLRGGGDDWMLTGVRHVPDALAQRFGGSDVVKFKVNGEVHSVQPSSDTPVGTKLAWYIRERAGFTGTKIGCGEGACGCCTVVLKNASGEVITTHSCQTDVFSLDGQEVTTTEGIGSTTTGLHRVQQKIAECGGTQCGFCTPGMVMAIYGYLKKGDVGTPAEAEKCVSGNLCRCTGYRPIMNAIHELVSDKESLEEPALLANVPVPTRRFLLRGSNALWVNCADLADVFAALQACGHQPHRLVVGNTSDAHLKHYTKFDHVNDKPNAFINIAGVQELRRISSTDSSVKFGASVTLSRMLETFKSLVFRVPSFQAAVSHLDAVASPQVRDAASWAGNVMMAKAHPDFPSDICMLLATYHATLSLSDGRTLKHISVRDFLSGADLAVGQIITQVEIPFPSSGSHMQLFKLHGEMNAGFHFSFREDGRIASLHGVVGNLIHGPFFCAKTHLAVVGQMLSLATFQHGLAALQTEATAVLTGQGASQHPLSVSHRKGISASLLHKAWVGAMLARYGEESVPANLRSAAAVFDRPASSGKQTYVVDTTTAPVGEPIEKSEARIQASGQAKYAGDILMSSNTAVAHVVVADRMGTIKAIDASGALALDGVVGFISAETVKELGASNQLSMYPMKIFAAGSVQYVGQIVGLVCATSFATAKAGAALVTLQWAEQELADAADRIVPDGDPIFIPAKAEAPRASHTISGGLSTSGQRHFYMETQVTYAVPDGTGGLEVDCSTQCFDDAQNCLSATLGIPMNKIVVKNARMGGAYGGKSMIYAGVAGAACVAALSINRPVLLQLDRNNDFLGLGGRNLCQATWSADITDGGQIVGLTETVVADAGIDESGAMPSTTLAAYDISNVKMDTKAKVTPKPWKTIMRAPGEFQGVLFMEAIIEQAARVLGVDPTAIQDVNMLSDTESAGVRQLWSGLKGMYDSARTATDAFNAENRWRKRGVYLQPLMYIQGKLDDYIGYQEKAAVTVYGDGSVAINSTGLEMGQGINTKVEQGAAMIFRQQVASDFDLRFAQTSFPKSTQAFSYAGITPSWGSGTSESCVSAVMRACEVIAKNLEDYKAEGSWRKIVAKAAADGVELHATGIHLQEESSQSYPVPCVSLVEVELDVHTGAVQVLKAEIQQDCGKSLNPYVDVGQIEGCFVQALGFCLTEEEIISEDDQRMLNNSAWTYKIPRASDIPIEMNVTLPKSDNKADGQILGSKATGEASICIGPATFFAVKDAIFAARKEAGIDGYFRMDVPATAARVKEACGVQF